MAGKVFSARCGPRSRVALVGLAAGCAAFGACVSKGTHQELEAKHKETEESLAAARKENAQLKGGLDAERRKAQGLTQDLSSTEKDKAALEKDRAALQGDVEKMRLALAELEKRRSEADRRVAEYKDLLSRFQGLIDAGKLRVKIVDGRMVVELATDVLFPSGSAKLSKEGKAAVAEVSTLLASIPDKKYQVEGHTDDVPIKSARYPSNWELAADRAITVVKEMSAQGLMDSRVSAASFGDTKPVRANDAPEGRAANRRIEIVVVPDLSSLPGFDELNDAAKAPAKTSDAPATAPSRAPSQAPSRADAP